MDHQSYIRRTDNKETAVLMIHGILGTPRHFDPFLDVIPQEWSVFNILLDGHGKKVRDFSRTSMNRWEKQILYHMAKLSKEYDHIFIMGHSMGTLLAIEAYVAYPEKVRGMILLNVPLSVHLKPTVIKNSVKILTGKEAQDEAAAKMKESGSIQTNRLLWQYMGWIPRYLELFGLIRLTRTRLSQIQVPTYTFQALQDELVSDRAISYLEGHSMIHNHILEYSGHFSYSLLDQAIIKRTIRQMIERST